MATAQTKTNRLLASDFPSEGHYAVVLGARAGNIGGAIAEYLYHTGWIVQENDCHRPPELARTTDDMDELYFHPEYQPPSTKSLELYNACVITLGVTHMEPFSEVTRANFRKVIYGSLELPIECARRYVRARTRYINQLPLNAQPQRLGVIVFIGSYAHDHPFTHCTSYCTAKAGLDMAVRCLAWELMPEGFDVFIIHPHHVQGTPMTDEVLDGMQNGVHKMTLSQAQDYQRKDLRMPDLLAPSNIAGMVYFLLTHQDARWLAGTSIKMYGGVR